MILGFSTKLNGKETFFVEKTHKCFSLKEIYMKAGLCEDFYPNGYNYYIKGKCLPKLHTIRDDPNNRWHRDIMIDFFINVRKKNMFRFAPKLPVVSTQEVFMTYSHSDLIQISIDGRELFSYTERLEFAINDGFDNWEDFFNYFYSKIKASKDGFYKAKLIHWTHLKY